MTDLDRLLRSDISSIAADAIRPPDFDPIERRGVRRRRTRTLLAAAAAVVIVLVAVDASPRSLGAKDGTLTPAGPPPPRSMPVSGEGELEAGTYLAPIDESTAFAYTITFPSGWTVQGGNEYHLHEDEPGGIGILPFLVDGIYADACLGDRGSVTLVGASPGSLVTALLSQRGPTKSAPVQTTLGGYPATRIDLRVPQSLQTQNCFLGPGTGVQLWVSGEARYLVLGPRSMVSVYVVDVDGRRQVFTAQYDPDRVSPADRTRLQQILDSIAFEGSG